jgi:hypothetical protein
METPRIPELDLAIQKLRQKIGLWTWLVRAIEYGITKESKALAEGHGVDQTVSPPVHVSGSARNLHET